MIIRCVTVRPSLHCVLYQRSTNATARENKHTNTHRRALSMDYINKSVTCLNVTICACWSSDTPHAFLGFNVSLCQQSPIAHRLPIHNQLCCTTNNNPASTTAMTRAISATTFSKTLCQWRCVISRREIHTVPVEVFNLTP
jgi:hypothetical protein